MVHDNIHPAPKSRDSEPLDSHDCSNCGCESCENYVLHINNKNIARTHMKEDEEKASDPLQKTALFTVDMQKVITMPKLCTKVFFFSRKLVLFNETFAEVGKNKPAICMLWSEEQSGRKAFDVASAYVLFIRKHCRDYDQLILPIYADNCNAKNNNKIL